MNVLIDSTRGCAGRLVLRNSRQALCVGHHEVLGFGDEPLETVNGSSGFQFIRYLAS
jgi:hypothetical protein